MIKCDYTKEIRKGISIDKILYTSVWNKITRRQVIFTIYYYRSSLHVYSKEFWIGNFKHVHVYIVVVWDINRR